MNEELAGHLHEAIDWIGYGALAIFVPVVITTAHATFKNYQWASRHN